MQPGERTLALGLEAYRWHLLLCGGPRCCRRLQGDEVWAVLRTRLRELERRGRVAPGAIRATRVDCLTVCRKGPILVVYPGGAWYGVVDAAGCERILEEHIVRGRIVDEHLLALRSGPFGARRESDGVGPRPRRRKPEGGEPPKR
ncbi:MAG: ferredoxin [Planctomycetota bacterium]|nr:MAG: ferredoxin [Planctomycetota bacterium]